MFHNTGWCFHGNRHTAQCRFYLASVSWIVQWHDKPSIRNHCKAWPKHKPGLINECTLLWGTVLIICNSRSCLHFRKEKKKVSLISIKEKKLHKDLRSIEGHENTIVKTFQQQTSNSTLNTIYRVHMVWIHAIMYYCSSLHLMSCSSNKWTSIASVYIILSRWHVL